MLPLYSQPTDVPQNLSPAYHKKSKHKGELFEQRIKILKEQGVITEDEEKELLDAINEVKTYKEQVWSDGKLTKEEQQNLLQKQRNLREKIRSVLDKAKEEFIEEKSPQECEKVFNARIDKMLNNKKITQKQADELKKQHKELLQLEEKIWSDDVMTKEEQEELFKQRKKFHKTMREILKKEYKHKKINYPKHEYKKGKLPHDMFCPGDTAEF